MRGFSFLSEVSMRQVDIAVLLVLMAGVFFAGGPIFDLVLTVLGIL